MEDIDRERIVVFIADLAPKVESVFSRFHRFRADGQNDLKTIAWTQYFHCVFNEMKTQTFENASVWTGPEFGWNSVKSQNPLGGAQAQIWWRIAETVEQCNVSVVGKMNERMKINE